MTTNLTIHEVEIEQEMEDAGIPAEKFDEFFKYLEVDKDQWLRDNAKAFVRDVLAPKKGVR